MTTTTNTHATVRTLCPAWCSWQHSELSDADGVSHETEAGTVTLSNGSTLSAAIIATDDSPAPRVSIYDSNDMDGLTRDDLGALAAFIGQATIELAKVEAMAEPVPVTAEDLRQTGGRAVAEQVLLTIDHKALSVADVAAGLPVAEVEDVLHRHPDRLDLRTAFRLAAGLGVPLSTLMGRAQQAQTADLRPVVDGGQELTVLHYEQPDAEAIFLDQVVDIDGPDVILAEVEVRNGSGRVVGRRYTITTDAAEAIRASIAAGVEAGQE